MIIDNGKYYIYRHIRLDTGVPFYIGIGTKDLKFNSKYEIIYKRAFNKPSRNKIWWDIVNKTDYDIEILMESEDYNFLLRKETEFVKLYGRINLGTGILSNLTDGGDSPGNVIISEESKRKMSLNHRDRGKFGKDNSKSKTIYQYNLKYHILYCTFLNT